MIRKIEDFKVGQEVCVDQEGMGIVTSIDGNSIYIYLYKKGYSDWYDLEDVIRHYKKVFKHISITKDIGLHDDDVIITKKMILLAEEREYELIDGFREKVLHILNNPGNGLYINIDNENVRFFGYCVNYNNKIKRLELGCEELSLENLYLLYNQVAEIARLEKIHMSKVVYS